MKEKAFKFLVVPLVVMLVVLCLIIFCIPILVLVLGNVVWFRWRNRGKVFLIYTRRHGWNEFLYNNLFPAVVPEIEPVEYTRGRDAWPWLLSNIYSPGYSKPFLAKVSWSGIRYIGLHELLLPLKKHGARRTDIQAQLREMLATQ
jgi:hypothetical protein